ncbi:MAG: hypothetical protein WCF57_14215 [Pyrinomonadaceae bacterium]
MMRSFVFCSVMICALACAGIEWDTQVRALAAQTQKGATVCGNPKVSCGGGMTFEPYDLPFNLPERAVIFDTEPFYAIMLKSVRANKDDCNSFVSEQERLRAQSLFPENKVFASRCYSAGSVYYAPVAENQHFMAVYAGKTRAEAGKMLAAVKATGKYPGANIRRLRAGINGT